MRAIVLVLACLVAAPLWASELVGATVPPYPDGMSSSMGSCIAHGDDLCAYSIASLNNADQAVVAIAAMQIVERIDGKPVWKIVDLLHDAPEAAEGQIWAFEECSVAGEIDPSVIGLVTFKDRGGWIEADETVWAVSFDIDDQKLVALDSSKVRCALPG